MNLSASATATARVKAKVDGVAEVDSKVCRLLDVDYTHD